MHVHLNDRLIQRRSKIARYSSTAGLIILALGMFAVFRGPQYTWASFTSLLLGLIASQVGMYHMKRWGRSPRPDEVLAGSLKGLDKRYHFYGWLLPTEYVLLGPAGLFVFVVRDQRGEVIYSNGRWKQPFSWTRLLTIFAQEGMGSPEKDTANQIARLRQFIAKKSDDPSLAELPIQGVVVFMLEGVKLNMEAKPEVPVLLAKQLKQHIRGLGKGEKLEASLRRELELLFEQ